MERPNTTNRKIELDDSRFHFHGGNAPPLLRAGLHLAELTAGQRLTAILLLQIGQLSEQPGRRQEQFDEGRSGCATARAGDSSEGA